MKQTRNEFVKSLGDHIFYFIVFVMVLVLLSGCAAGPVAEAVSCRGTAFQINPQLPTATLPQTAGAQ